MSLVASLAGYPHLSSAQAAPSWPTFHGGPTRDGASAINGPTTNARANVFSLGNTVEDSPVVDAAGIAYIGDDAGNVYALDPSSPAGPRWTFSAGNRVVGSPALSPDGKTLYVATDAGSMYAINTANGQQVWKSAQNVGLVHGAPVVSKDGSTVYVASALGELYSLNASTGDLKWKLGTGSAVSGSPTLSPDGSTIYVETANWVLEAIPAGGQQGGSGFPPFYLDYAPGGSPAVDAGGNIYATSTAGSLLLFTTGSSAPRWTFTPASHMSSVSTPAIAGGIAVYGISDGSIYAVNTSNGQSSWTDKTGGGISSSPVIATGNNMVYVGSDDGSVYAYTSTGTRSWTKQVGAAIRSSPALAADGSLWVASSDGTVARFHQPGSPVSPPGTPTAGPSATPGPTNTPAATATATATPPPALAISLSSSSVTPGKKMTVTIHGASGAVVHIRVDYANGDHQSHAVTLSSSGTGTYSYTQGASKIFHNKFNAKVTASITGGPTASQTYKVNFGSIDVSAEPRTQKVGGKVNIYVHGKRGVRATATLIFPNGKVQRFPVRNAGKNGFVHFVYTVGKNLTKGNNKKVTVQGTTYSPTRNTKTWFTIS